MLASGPYTHAPNDTLEFIYAIIWSRGTDHLDSVRQLKEDVFRMRFAAPSLLNLTEVVETSTQQSPAPAVIHLDQFPNPFTNRTTLQFTLPTPSHAQLSIYDVLGREIERLMDQPGVAGTHAVTFDGSNLPPGVYYARLETASVQLTKKLVIVR